MPFISAMQHPMAFMPLPAIRPRDMGLPPEPMPPISLESMAMPLELIPPEEPASGAGIVSMSSSIAIGAEGLEPDIPSSLIFEPALDGFAPIAPISSESMPMPPDAPAFCPPTGGIEPDMLGSSSIAIAGAEPIIEALLLPDIVPTVLAARRDLVRFGATLSRSIAERSSVTCLRKARSSFAKASLSAPELFLAMPVLGMRIMSSSA
ncbi:MAG: hypothetical protein K2Y35_05390 [Burkholderiales bacterium]|nr:hypothetical protein [Burkholderiales bacterium]